MRLDGHLDEWCIISVMELEPTEFDPEAHELMVRGLYGESKARLGRIALFEEMMRYVDAGQCTFEEAIEQYKHDVVVGE